MEKKNKYKSWVEEKRDPENLPIATKEQTDYIEEKLMKLCGIYLEHFENLSEKRFGALLQRAMCFDVERGLGLGQIPHRRYIHSDFFNQWEDSLWEKINSRLDNTSDNFFKM